MEEIKKLAPQSCVVAMEIRTARSTCYKQFGAGVVIAMGVHRIGERMNVRKVTPPRLIVILKVVHKSQTTREGGHGRTWHPAQPGGG